MNSQELYEAMSELWVNFVVEHEKAINGNKSAGGRARKAIGEIKKMVTEYRKSSIEESKK
jgi:hypothetical protein